MTWFEPIGERPEGGVNCAWNLSEEQGEEHPPDSQQDHDGAERANPRRLSDPAGERPRRRGSSAMKTVANSAGPPARAITNAPYHTTRTGYTSQRRSPSWLSSSSERAIVMRAHKKLTTSNSGGSGQGSSDKTAAAQPGTSPASGTEGANPQAVTGPRPMPRTHSRPGATHRACQVDRARPAADPPPLVPARPRVPPRCDRRRHVPLHRDRLTTVRATHS